MLEAKLEELERLMGAKAVVNQYSRSTLCALTRRRVKDMLDPVQTNRCIRVATISMSEMPSRLGVYRPRAAVGAGRPDDEWVKDSAVSRNALDRRNHGPLDSSSTVLTQIMAGN